MLHGSKIWLLLAGSGVRRNVAPAERELQRGLGCGGSHQSGLVESQIIALLIQATSRVLKEGVTFSGSNVT
jgi:hypothetical protein